MISMMMRSFFIALLLLFSGRSTDAGESTLITIHYTSVNSTGSSNWVVAARLTGGNRVEEASEGVTRSGLRGNASKSATLGGTWRVISANKLRRTLEHENHFQIFEVKIQRGACHAAVWTQLKPGRSSYIVGGVRGDRIESSKPRYTNVYCAIQ